MWRQEIAGYLIPVSVPALGGCLGVGSFLLLARRATAVRRFISQGQLSPLYAGDR